MESKLIPFNSNFSLIKLNNLYLEKLGLGIDPENIWKMQYMGKEMTIDLLTK